MNLNTDWVNEKIPIHSSYMDLWSSSYGVLWSLLDPSRIRNPAIYGLPFGCVAFKTAMKCPATLVRCPSTGPWHYEVISFNPRPRGLSPCDSQAGYIYIYTFISEGIPFRNPSQNLNDVRPCSKNTPHSKKYALPCFFAFWGYWAVSLIFYLRHPWTHQLSPPAPRPPGAKHHGSCQRYVGLV